MPTSGERSGVTVTPARAADAEWLTALLVASWRATRVARAGRVDDAATLPALVARLGGERVGLLTYRECEVVTLDAVRRRIGVGSALLDAVTAVAREAGCARLWLVTTNDNTDALRWYQRRGFDLVALHRNAVLAARRAKPEIPEVGAAGIPIRHELELELDLRADYSST